MDIAINKYYKSKYIRQVKKPSAVAELPYIQSAYGRLNRFLARYDIKSVGLPHKKIFNFLRLVKDDVRLKTLGIYIIPSECDLVYIRQTGCSIKLRTKEHQLYLHVLQTDKSALSEHLIPTIKFSLTTHRFFLLSWNIGTVSSWGQQKWNYIWIASLGKINSRLARFGLLYSDR